MELQGPLEEVAAHVFQMGHVRQVAMTQQRDLLDRLACLLEVPLSPVALLVGGIGALLVVLAGWFGQSIQAFAVRVFEQIAKM